MAIVSNKTAAHRVGVSPIRTPNGWRVGIAAALLVSCSPAALHAETSNAELAKEIAELKAQIREMRGAIVTQKRVVEKVKVIAERRPAPGYTPPAPGYAIPAGAVPAFVTADKKLQFGALTITPGGFLAAESVFRSRTEQSDIGSQFNAIPFGPQAGTNEFRFSARQSRFAALIEAPITPSVLVSTYGEFDFLGSGVTSNENESNSFIPRIRSLYGTLDFADYGFHVLAGQNWSLATLNSKGITPRNEVAPPQIDSQFIPGFVWKRQPQIRITKDFDKRLWVSLSAEESQNTFSNCTPGVNGTALAAGNTGIGNNLITCQLTGNNNLNNITNFSLDHVPDVVGKVAYEAKLGERDVHLEGFGLYRDIYTRVAYPTATSGGVALNASNHDTTGYGIGGGLIVPVLPRKLDFQASGLYGRGIGTYGTTQFSDATFNPNGSGAAIPESMILAGMIAHVTPAIDLYAFGGVEQVQPKYYATNAAGTNFAGSGYGVPTANNTGCFNSVSTTGAPGLANPTAGANNCAGNTKRIWQLTGGLWDKIYKGSFGEVRVGVQYSYTQRELFSGNGAYTTAAGVAVPYFRGSPKQDDQAVLTSFRYYPFQ